ncbi:MAG: patatin-like phospholipase family protein [Patescibacteria group bacterium]|nr:patatin-like phospholipase family protein [Patescibacteria group bacterium]
MDEAHNPENYPSVLEVLARRHIKHTLGIEEKDNFKLGLIVEGGAMRSIVSAGMLLALRDLHMLKHFDIFMGSSGGSTNLAYVLSGQGDKGLSIFHDHMVDEKVINPFHAMPGGDQIVQMKKFENIMSRLVTIDHPQLKAKYDKRLFIGTTNMDLNRGDLIQYDTSKLDRTVLIDFLLAGATIPVVAGKYRTIQGTRYCDAGIYYPDPLMLGEDTDCTHVLVLRSKTTRAKYHEYAAISDLQMRIIKKMKPDVAEIMSRRLKEFRIKVAESTGPEIDYKHLKSYSVTVPRGGHDVSRLTTDQWKLIEGSKAGYAEVLKLLSIKCEVNITPTMIAR